MAMKENIEKVGVAWNKTFKNKLEGIKIAINDEIYVAYKNKKKQKETDPDYIITKFIDTKKGNKK